MGAAQNRPAVAKVTIQMRFTFRDKAFHVSLSMSQLKLTCCRFKKSERLWNRCEGEAGRSPLSYPGAKMKA
jgi:hypothetical protein